MNVNKAYRSLQAAYRALRQQMVKTKVELMQARLDYKELANADLGYAELVNQAYLLRQQLRDTKQQLDESKTLNDFQQRSLTTARDCMRSQAEDMRKQKMCTAIWAYAFLVQAGIWTSWWALGHLATGL